MNPISLHPSLRTLLRFHAQARLRMFARRVRTPRRLALTILAFLLTAVWIGQAIAGILYRPSADPTQMAIWIPVGLLSYGLWHILKTTCRKPIEPFEWTPTEQELLGAAPLARKQVVGFRLTSVIASAVIKALLFAVVMMPDLPVWPLGFVGMLLALVFLDLIRMTLEVVVWGMSPQTFVRTRCAIIVLAIGCAVSALISAHFSPAGDFGSLPSVVALVSHFLKSLIELKHTLPGMIVQLPFHSFANLILANGTPLALVGQLLIAIVTVAGSAWSLLQMDSICLQQRVSRATAEFPHLAKQTKQCDSLKQKDPNRQVRVPRSLNGAGTIIWRQTWGMFHYGPSILFSMLIPGLMSLLPLWTDVGPLDTVLQITGGLVFYSFLLMPAALRFDYRRDVDRMAVLKALPISPAMLTIGQLATPVLACTLFQTVVLALAMVVRPYSIGGFLLCVAMLIPVNIVIFALENLIFILFPYRPNQEGIAVFLRTMLTFTAKGLIFVLALLAMVVWIAAARWMVNHTSFGTPLLRMVAFTCSGIWIAMWAAGFGLTALVSRVYLKFDPSQDTPPMS